MKKQKSNAPVHCSAEYKRTLYHFHSVTKHGWGGTLKEAGALDSFMFEWAPDSILDFGCGKGAMVNMFEQDYGVPLVVGYDPGVRKYMTPDFSRQYEMVCCNDVLEHVEPAYLDQVMEHINKLAEKYIWLRIDTVPAKKILPDGRNAHLILQQPEWWKSKISEHFKGDIVHENVNKKGKYDVAIEKHRST